MAIFMIIVIILMFGALAYSGLVSIGYDNFKGITLELDEMYSNTSEMAYATIQELKKQGKECEILEIGNGYPKLLVNGKKYILTPKMASVKGFPVQVMQLRLCKE